MTPTPVPVPRVVVPPGFEGIVRLPAIILGVLAAAGLLWLAVQAIRYLAVGKQQRPVLRLAWRVRRTWSRTAIRLGLARTEPARSPWWSLRPAPPSSAMRQVVPAILVHRQRFGIDVDVAAVGRVGLAELQAVSAHLADAWRVPIVRALQLRPGIVRIRALLADPLTQRTQWTDTSQIAGDQGTWVAGVDGDGQQVNIRSAEVSGMVVAGLPGYGKTSFLNARFCALAGSGAVQFVLVDGKGGPDWDDLAVRAWLFAKDDPQLVRDHLVRVKALLTARQHAIRRVLGVKNLWHLGPSPSWPLVLVIIDEAHSVLTESKGTDAESKRLDALARETARVVEELVRKGRNVGIQVILATQKATGDAIPTRIRDNCQVAVSFAQRTSEAAVAVLGADITASPGEHPRRLVDPAYVGVASMVAQARPGFTLVRTPSVPDTVAEQIAHDTAHLVRDPLQLLDELEGGENGGPFRQEDTAALSDTNPHQKTGGSRSWRF